MRPREDVSSSRSPEPQGSGFLLSGSRRLREVRVERHHGQPHRPRTGESGNLACNPGNFHPAGTSVMYASELRLPSFSESLDAWLGRTTASFLPPTPAGEARARCSWDVSFA